MLVLHTEILEPRQGGERPTGTIRDYCHEALLAKGTQYVGHLPDAKGDAVSRPAVGDYGWLRFHAFLCRGEILEAAQPWR